MSFTLEQPSSFDFEECCICSEEFSNDTDLANHLIKHAEENANLITNDGDRSPTLDSPQMAMAKESFPEYTQTNLTKPQPLQKSFPSRPLSPEVWEINSDDSGDEQSKQSTKLQPQRPMMNHQQGRNVTQGGPSFRNTQAFRSVGRPPNGIPNNNLNKQYSQMAPPFNCNTCSSVFTDPKMFRDHLLTHEKPRPYSCNICNKTFAYKGTLRQHLRLHIGEKLHECPTCRKRFTIKAVLKKHCEEMHGIFTNSS